MYRYLGLIKVNLDTRKLLPGVQPLLLGGANSSRNVQQDPAILQLLKQYEGPVEAMKTTVAGWCGGLGMHTSDCCGQSKPISLLSYSARLS
jgi:hypothetical protein